MKNPVKEARTFRSPTTLSPATTPEEQSFAEVVEIIQATRGRALAAVNTALIDLYWQVGEYISRKLEGAIWGEGVVAELADYIHRSHPSLRGFTRRNLFRMRQFFDAYARTEVVPALLAQLPWTHHLLILGRCKTTEEREFYIRLAAKEKWSSRDLERQLAGSLFERAVLNPPKVARTSFHRSVLLCASKDNEVVEYALSRSLSPALVAEYQTRLPDKTLLRTKLHEFYALTTAK